MAWQDRILQYVWRYDALDDAATRSAWRRLLQILAMVVRDLMDGMITLRAMSLVYTTLLSLVPLLAVSISVLKGFGVHDQLEPALVRLLAPVGENNVEVAARIVGFVDNMRFGVLGAVGLAMLLYTAISLIQKIEAAFNQTWRLRSSRTLMQRFSDYLSVIMVGPVLVFSAVGITASLGSNHVIDWLDQLPYMSNLLQLLGRIVPYLLVIAAFTFIYMLVPNTRVQLRSALYGAVIAGLLWESAGKLFTSFVGGSTSYTAVYSGLAILLVFMIWLYVSWIILLIGSSIAFYHQNPENLNWKKRDLHLSARMRDQLALQVMVSVARSHDRQSGLVPTAENLAAYQRVPLQVLQRMLDALVGDGLLQTNADSPPRYLPGAALERIRIGDVFNSARAADDEGQTDSFYSDAPVTRLLQALQQQFDSEVGALTLADFIRDFDDGELHEDRIV
ncbi:MAG: YihY/virulence factor BrkB family protein [Gammaproteobacteria bacterium]|nr:YihY/virulence factor BrkB family protein [Gammaproteobacteria bacterium]